MLDAQQHVLRRAHVSCFKSITAVSLRQLPTGLLSVTGANGTGKSVLLEAIAFACAASNGELRIDSLAELCPASAAPRVELEFVNGAGRILKVACTVVDGKRCAAAV